MPPIRMVGAGKRYTKFDDQPMLATAAMRLRSRTRRSSLWAVRHVDLEVHEGESVGVIGPNGAGKSTMLQMLAGVTAPTEGLVAVRGRVAPLVSVGVGFHPELTGRENVYVNGTILGLTRAQIDRRFDAIVDFAQIERFIDTPVKFYSSGMFVRLGFAVAVQAEPDVLLVDEVLAVGDLAFQLKCFDHMMAVRESGTTIVVVSHNLNAVRRMCSRTVVLHGGTVRFDGGTVEGISLFHDLLGERRDLDDEVPDDKVRGGVAEIESVALLGSDGTEIAHAHTGDELRFRVQVRFDRPVEDPAFGFNISTQHGVPLYTENTFLRQSGRYEAGQRLRLEVDVVARLGTGSFAATIGVTDAQINQLARSRPLLFYVTGRDGVTGAVDLDARFEVHPLGSTGDMGGGRDPA